MNSSNHEDSGPSSSPPSFPKDLFAGTARYYADHRVPYPRDYLADLMEKVEPSRKGCLMDLGSGPGRVAIPLARFFREVRAVDQEPEMIEVGIQESARCGVTNVRWIVSRAEDVEASPDSFEMITIGEAFHRMDRPLVARRALEWLQPGHYLAIMGCNSVWKGKEDWQLRAVEVIARWMKPRRTDGMQASTRRSLSDVQVLREAGFVDIENFRFAVPHTWSLDSFIGYLYSTSVVSRRVLGEKVDDFEADLRQTLLSHDSSGYYQETLDFYYDLARCPET